MTMTTTLDELLANLGTLENNEDNTIQRNGANLVDEFLSTFEYYPDMETTADILWYLTDIQVRDYALGLLDKPNTHKTAAALKYLVDQAPVDSAYINAPASLLGQLCYEQGSTGDAFLMLSTAQPDYSLALLLKRVFDAGWPKESFAKMRAELHPKVVASIFGDGEE